MFCPFILTLHDVIRNIDNVVDVCMVHVSFYLIFHHISHCGKFRTVDEFS